MSTTEIPVVESTRVVEGHTVPAVGAWAIDKSHSSVEFVVRHLMVAKVRGRFTDYDATITIADRPEDSHVEVAIALASVTTGDEGRDAHLRNADFFDVENHPTATFNSTSVSPAGKDKWRVVGDLTIRNTTKPVTLDVEFNGAATDPWGNAKAFFEASTEIDREDWGLDWNQPLAGGGVLVGKKIKLELAVEAARVVETEDA
jgi:polyisoprenoid-binding protein YceI